MQDLVKNLPNSCLNCQAQLPEAAAFCPRCGQKNTDGLISLKEFLYNFLENVFNIDSRIVQTTKWLCIPAKLTKEYFKGKHRTYYHPIRLYLVMSIIFFAILSFMQGDKAMIEMGLDEDFSESAYEEKFISNNLVMIDSLSAQIIRTNPHPSAKAALDSLRKKMPRINARDSVEIDGIMLDRLDMLNLNGRELIEKYKIEGLWKQIHIKQEAHLRKDPNALFRQIASNLPIMLLVMMPALALFLKLLYFRSNRYFVEHLVLNFHHHALAFFIFSIILLLPEKLEDVFLPVGLIFIFISLLLAMQWYYGQIFWKTFIKYILFNIFYFISFLVSIILTFIISFFLF